MLLETAPTRRRLYRPGDPADEARRGAKTTPARSAIPPEYHALLDWYEREYASQPGLRPEADPLLALRGSGRELWADEHADDYVRRLRIYLLEDFGPQSDRVVSLRERMLERADELCTSTFTLGEVLVKPAEQGNEALRHRYEEVLSRTARVIAFDREVARRYAGIRRNRSIRPPDAIQLACAAQVGVDLFITNDDRLSRLTIPGIHFLVPLDRAFL
jgi:predicted nucleic acid-binding protein